MVTGEGGAKGGNWGAGLPHPHGCKDNGEVVSTVVQDILGLLHQPSLATDLGSNLEERAESR